MTPLLLGHRGTPKLHRENTLAGYRAALDAGLDGVELDVRRLVDGTLVMHHDPHLKDGRVLRQMVRADLPEYVPTLDDTLAWMAGTSAFVNVEIKLDDGPVDDRVARTLDAIRQYGVAGRVIVSSFSPLALKAALEHAPEIPRGLLYHRTYHVGHDLIPVIMRRVQAAALHPRYHLIDESLMALARDQGWQVNTWTVNDPGQVQRLAELGVHALIGDLPDVLLLAR